jgi:regulator of protease activity HflC (stomatin/prohibitin superfamily)
MTPDAGQPGSEAPAQRRAASVRLRRPGAEEATGARMLDPATQSLGEALRVTFRVLQLGMLVLLALFVFSGYQTIGESERGIPLWLGVPRGERNPGPSLSAPFPLGDLIKVRTGTQQLELNREFWYSLEGRDPGQTPAQHAAAGIQRELKPGRDGSLVTGDGYQAHLRCTVLFRRVDATRWARNMHPTDEEAIVRAAVQRGLVQAVAETSLENLLKQREQGQAGALAERAREIAQRSLDRAESGIEIDGLTVREPIPPLGVYKAFTDVETASANSKRELEEARAQAAETLNVMAGAAASGLLELIARYEEALAAADASAASGILDSIDAILGGRDEAAQVSGRVAGMIADATAYRSTVVSRRRSEYRSFQAKYAQYVSNPQVVLQSEWVDAWKVFAGRGLVEKLIVPRGTESLEMVINADPEILRQRQRDARLQENLRARQQRDEMFRENQFRTDTTSQVYSADPGR